MTQPRNLMSALALAALTAQPLVACELALVLAVDVSGSVDPREYRVQMDGMAQALRDQTIASSLVDQQAAVAVVQWTGAGRQTVTIDWTRTLDLDDVDAMASQIEQAGRRWRNFSTAIGEALTFSLAHLERAPACDRQVIDVSGDGQSNEGIAPQGIHPALAARDVTVNGLAIEGNGGDLTAYYEAHVIHGYGAFVATADGYQDYPRAIRAKLFREVVKQLAALPQSRDHAN
ncbi:MAG: DUF1194 domain-containing protein [Pseudomonadota bacterium]